MENAKSDHMGKPETTSQSQPEVGKSNETSESSKVAFDEESFFAVLVLICVAGIGFFIACIVHSFVKVFHQFGGNPALQLNGFTRLVIKP